MNHRAKVKEYVRCSLDPFYFFTKYCYTEKRISIGDREEILYPDYKYLRKMVENFMNPGNVIDVKSRQMMWSITGALCLLWLITFRDNFSSKVTSYKEEKVDDGGVNSTTESIFGKIRFTWLRLPMYLKAPLFFSFLRIKNTENDSYIKGESTNQQAGRGGTYSIVMVDEWAFVPKSETIYAALHSACPNNKKIGSTPNGKGNNFARLFYMRESDSGYKANKYHWKLNPEKTQDWYDKETKGLTAEQKAREYELSFEGSVQGRVYYMFDSLDQVIDYEYNPELPTYTTWDFGLADPTTILFIQENPNGDIYIFNEYTNNEEEPEFYADIVHSMGYKFVGHTGDPAGKARGVRKDSWISALGKCGIYIQVPVYATKDKMEFRIASGRSLMKRVFVSKRCVGFMDAITNYRFPTDDIGRVLSETPIHDWSSHYATAYEYYCCVRWPVVEDVIDYMR